MHSAIVDDIDDEIQEGLAQRRIDRQHSRALSAHPDCRDPDHPGCESCWEDEFPPDSACVDGHCSECGELESECECENDE